MAVKRVEGVREAEFSFKRSEGFVTFDTTVTSTEAIIAELERMTDFTATVRETDSPEAVEMPTPAGEGGRDDDDKRQENDGND